MVYRIYTEDKNVSKVEEIVSRYFPGFTIITCQGYWKGEKEHSIIIEICENDVCAHNEVVAITKEIKRINDQKEVLVQKINCITTLL